MARRAVRGAGTVGRGVRGPLGPKSRGSATPLFDAAKDSAAIPLAPLSYAEASRRPLQALVFVAPLIVAYEVGMSLAHPSLENRPDVAALTLLRAFFSLFGAGGYHLPTVALVVVLLCWHAAARHPWRVHFGILPAMAGESLFWGLSLFVLNDLLRGPTLMAASGDMRSLADDVILSIGAGLYEEMVFRLMVITATMAVLADFVRVRATWASATAIAVSSLAFAVHHYPPFGVDAFNAPDFAFRFAAGGYLAAVFVFRGMGIAVGAHAAYDIMVVALRGLHGSG